MGNDRRGEEKMQDQWTIIVSRLHSYRQHNKECLDFTAVKRRGHASDGQNL